MDWQFTPYLLPVIASAVSAALAFVAWQRRHAPGGVPFCLLMLSVAEWSLAYTIELAGPNLATTVFWDNVAWFGAATAPTFWFVFALEYTGRVRKLSPRTILLLAIEPAITVLLVWTNPFHGLMGTDNLLPTHLSLSVLVVRYGLWYWFNIAYAYVLLFIGAFLIFLHVQTLRKSNNLYIGQAISLLVAVLAPWAGNVLSLLNLSPFHMDLTTLALTITGLAMAWNLFRFRLLDIVPIAQEAVMESMRDAVIILDEQQRIVDMNPPALRLVQHNASSALARPFDEVFSGWTELTEQVAHCLDMKEGETEVMMGEMSKDGAARYFDLRVSPLYHHTNRNGHRTIGGHLIILNDITEHKQSDMALKESAARFRNIFAEAPIGMALIDLKGNILQVNKAFYEMLAYPEQELLGCNIATITHPDDAGKGKVLARQALEGTISSYKVEKRFLRKDGEIVWADLTGTPLRNQHGQAVYGLIMLENIGERKRARLLEEERHHVAYELHDGLAQVTVSVHQHLQAFAGHYRPRSAQARQELGRALELAQHSVREARRLIAGLRPTALDDFGLATALRLQVEALHNDGWTITFEETLGSERLPTTIETTLYGVAQEALTNIRKHAQTTEARISLQRQPSLLSMEIQDWGRGFDPEAALKEEHRPGEHLGLREMRERVELVGGQLRISSQPTSGTLITAEIPLPPTSRRESVS
jgi:PAS domain S-box-containing protein